MLKKILLLLLVIISSRLSYAQRTSAGIAVSAHADSPDSLLRKIDHSPDDTNKVRILLKLCEIYWHKHVLTGADSCIFFAQNAHNLSSKLHFTDGVAESLFMECKGFTLKDDPGSAKALLPVAYGEERVRLFLVIGEYFVFLPGVEKHNLDQAFPYIVQARRLSDSLHSRTWIYQSKMLLAKYYFELGDYTAGKKCILEIIDDCDKLKDTKSAAFYWTEIQEYLPNTADNYAFQKYSMEMAYHLYLKINDKKDALSALRDLAIVNIRYDHLDTAEKQYDRVFSMIKELKLLPTFETLYYGARLYLNKGDLNRALDYEIKILNLSNLNDREKMYAWKDIGYIYYIDNSYQNSLLYSRKAFDLAMNMKAPELYYIFGVIMNDQIAVGAAQKSFSQLNAFIMEHPTLLAGQKEVIASLLGKIYNGMGQYGKAEQQYLQMIRLDEEVQLENKKTVHYSYDNLGAMNAYKILGEFYFERRQFSKASKYLKKAIREPKQVTGEIKDQNEAELFLSKTDSAMGDYQTALKHYILHTAINDSIFNTEKSRQLTELSVKYETKQKEQSIQLLQSQDKASRAHLQQLGQQRNIILGGTVLLLIISSLVYSRYHIKRRSNLILQKQQTALQLLVNEKNILISDKDHLLIEKDLLLKEVHHRVKNNLHMVMSLMESQSSYLNNSAAKTAIFESQNRVRAIALIHQKLYNSANVVQVDMQPYVQELVTYLSESFGTAKQLIFINHQIDPIYLDISQALPIGIILNETITNAIKYAFNGKKGAINILMHEKANMISLSIMDNGIGIPADVDSQNLESLGMTLIKGLSLQLGGKLKIENNNGLNINIDFLKDETLHFIS